MAKKLFTVDVELDSMEKYEDIESKIKEKNIQDPNYTKNLEMRCDCIVNGGILDFNLTTASLLVAFAAFFISLFKEVNIEDETTAGIVFFVSLVVILFEAIRQHVKKCKAQKILFVIKKMMP